MQPIFFVKFNNILKISEIYQFEIAKSMFQDAHHNTPSSLKEQHLFILI